MVEQLGFEPALIGDTSLAGSNSLLIEGVKKRKEAIFAFLEDYTMQEKEYAEDAFV